MKFYQLTTLSLPIVFLLSFSLYLAAAGSAAAEERMNVWNALDKNPGGSIEFPQNDPNIPEIWLDTDKMSYAPGDDAIFFVHTTAKTFSYTIERDGAESELVKRRTMSGAISCT